MMTRFRKITSALVVVSVVSAGTAYAAVKYLRDFSAVVGITDNDNTFWCQVVGGCQSTDPLKRVTMAQIWQYVFSKVTGDFTINSSTGVGTLANTAVTPGTYGDATHVSQVTLDSKGRTIGAANVAIAGSAGGTVTTVKDGATTVNNPAIINYTAGCVVTNAAGNANVACSGGGGGSGTVNSGTLGQLAWYPATGAAVSGTPNVSVLGGSLVSNFNAVALPAPPADGGAGMQIGNSDGNISRYLADSFGTGVHSSFAGRSARGTNASKSASQTNDLLATLAGFGYGTTSYSNFARGRFNIAAAQAWTDAAQGTRATVTTTANGTTTANDRLAVENDGGVTVAADATGAPPTGGSKGPGTVNVAGAYYLNGALVGTGSGVNGGATPQTVTGSATITSSVVYIGTGFVTGTLTLPAISTLGPSPSPYCIVDSGQNVDLTHALSIQPNAADSIGGGTVGAGSLIGPLTNPGYDGCFRVAGTTSGHNNWTNPGIPTQAPIAHNFLTGVGLNNFPATQPNGGDLSDLPANHTLVTSTGTGLGGVAPGAAGNVATSNGTDWTSATPTGGGGSSTPQGRLTLQSGAPVMTANQTAKTTIYYDSYVGNLYPNWSGSAMANITITSDEISMGLDAGVPHVASGSVYDIFGTASAAICVGPAWTSTTARGTGAGTTELQLKNGVWTNKVSLTNCWGGASGTTNLGAIAANQGTYLGSLYATAAGQTGMNFSPAAASGGANPILGLYNAYNRVLTYGNNKDNHAPYAGTGANSWAAYDASASNRVTVLDGLAQSNSSALMGASINPAAAQIGYVGMQRDGTTAPDIATINAGSGVFQSVSVSLGYLPALGLHFYQMIEYSTAVTVQFNNIESVISVGLAM